MKKINFIIMISFIAIGISTAQTKTVDDAKEVYPLKKVLT